MKIILLYIKPFIQYCKSSLLLLVITSNMLIIPDEIDNNIVGADTFNIVE